MPELSLRLGANFTLGELLRSDTAERDDGLKALQHNPPEGVVESLGHLVRSVLQPVRSDLGYPIRVTSGYRSPVLNKLVGGSAVSQHCLGEAADCNLSPNFLTDPAAAEVRTRIETRVRDLTGQDMPPGANASFYLFAFVCLDLARYDIDQLIHEYGEGYGEPAWVHLSASDRQDKRQILLVGSYTGKRYVVCDVGRALAYSPGRTVAV